LYSPQTPKATKADCRCPIVADGRLRNVAGRIQREGTGTNDWTEAEHVKAQWEAWGQFTDPNPKNIVNPTVDEAISKFKEHIAFKNLEQSPRQDFDQFFRLRLLPFCSVQKVTDLRQFDAAPVVRDCIHSWRNSKSGKALSAETKRAELERFRTFLSWSMANGWLKANHAKAKDLSVRTGPTKKKFGMNAHEVEWVLAGVNRLVDCYGRTGQRNAQETRAFCLVLRHSGLRISDVMKLHSSELVPRAKGTGWAIQVIQKKTKELVYVPLDDEAYDALQSLPFKGEKDGKEYWFYTGVGSMKTAVKTWRKRITKLFRLALVDEKGQPLLDEFGEPRRFEHHVSPHSWRHTFAISHLNAGTDIKLVSRWLGHASVSVTEKHYGHANRSTRIASEDAYDESNRRQREAGARVREAQPVANVVSITKRKRA
jgi:integrase